MNKKITIGILGIVVVGFVVAAIAFKGGNASQVASNGGVYCSQDGTLTNTMPIQSHRSYCLKSDSNGKTYEVNAPSEYSFSIIDDQGNTLKNFEVTHTKLMHVIVVRKDLAYFQHVHPDFDQTIGKFTLNDLTFPADGEYRIFADFAAAGGMKDPMGMPLTTTINEDVPVGNVANYKPQPIGSQENSKTFDGMQVSLMLHAMGGESTLTYNLSQNGKPVTDLETYLGALGHAVILREGNLDFIHAHPTEDPTAKQNGVVQFMVDFPEGGTYKVFTQFQRGGKVITTDFVIAVAQASSFGSSMPGMNMQSMPGMKM